MKGILQELIRNKMAEKVRMYGRSELSLSTAQMAGRFLRYLSTKDSPVESVSLKPESASVSASISMLHAS